MSKTNYLDKEEFINKSEAFYKGLKQKLEKTHKGEVVAIEPLSKKFFLGEDDLEAFLKAKKHLPGKIFYFIRVGYPAVHKLRRI